MLHHGAKARLAPLPRAPVLVIFRRHATKPPPIHSPQTTLFSSSEFSLLRKRETLPSRDGIHASPFAMHRQKNKAKPRRRGQMAQHTSRIRTVRTFSAQMSNHAFQKKRRVSPAAQKNELPAASKKSMERPRGAVKPSWRQRQAPRGGGSHSSQQSAQKPWLPRHPPGRRKSRWSCTPRCARA